MSRRTASVAVAVSAMHGGRAELLAGLAEPGVVGPEVVPPLADAVGLVDGQQAGLEPGHHRDEPGAAEPLGGDVDEVVPARLDLEHPRPLLGGVERAVDERRPQPALVRGRRPGPSSARSAG